MQERTSCLGHVVERGSAGKRLEIVYPIPKGTAPIPPGLVVHWSGCSLTFFSHELLNMWHFLSVSCHNVSVSLPWPALTPQQ